MPEAPKPKNPGGRPSKFDDAIATKILAYIRVGAYVETAALAAGINKLTFYRWLKLGAAGKEPYHGFCNAIEKTINEADVIALAQLDKFSGWMIPPEEAIALGAKPLPPSWQTIAWRLERRRPKHFGRRNPDNMQEGDDDVGGAVEPPKRGWTVTVVGQEQLPPGELPQTLASFYDPPQGKRDA